MLRACRSPLIRRFSSTLVLVEHNGGKVSPATLNTISAAKLIQQPITALVAGSSTKSVAAQVAAASGVTKVITYEQATDNIMPEVYAPLIVKIREMEKATHVVAPHSAFGKNIMPRVAALLDVAPISDVQSIVSGDTFVRSIYAGNALATVKSKDAIRILTVRATAFPAAADQPAAEIVASSEALPENETSKWLAEMVSKSDRPELDSAKRVVSGGRALVSGENFKILYDLADKLGAAAVDAGYVDNSMQIGQTGKIVAPELYIAVGISGAIQHLAGMKDSKVIVAINKDADAPIFQIADYGLVGDLFKLVPELTEKV